MFKQQRGHSFGNLALLRVSTKVHNIIEDKIIEGVVKTAMSPKCRQNKN